MSGDRGQSTLPIQLHYIAVIQQMKTWIANDSRGSAPRPFHYRGLGRILLAALAMGCASFGGFKNRGPTPPASFVKSSDDHLRTRTIDVRDGLSPEQAWKIVSDALAARFKLNVNDRANGLLQSLWQSPVVNDGIPDVSYRTRFTVKFIDNWKRVEVKNEAIWQPAGASNGGFDRDMLIDLTADLRARIGKS
jgi:hypothetical protein